MAKNDLAITDVKAYPISFPLPAENRISVGIGTVLKRDVVIVKVITAGGLVGWGESYHARAHTAVAKIIEATLRPLILGMEATDVVGVWERIYRYQLVGYGMGAGCSIAMSGIDLALWDIRGQVAGMPIYQLLGGSRKGLPAYAGGVALGYMEPAKLVEEVQSLVAAGYQAVKLKVGETPKRDIARIRAVREALSSELVLLTDANTAYTLDDARAVMPAMDELGVGWLEEPFPAPDYPAYKLARSFGRTPLAAGENYYTRFEFNRLLEDGAVRIWQPDLSKIGGITEGLRIAAIASANKVPIHAHSSMAGVNQAATIHFLAAIENAGYFEADVSKSNKFRDELVSKPWEVDKNGHVWPLDKPGLGVEVDEEFLAEHPPIEGLTHK